MKQKNTIIKPWDCEVCTYKNLVGKSQCEMCTAAAPINAYVEVKSEEEIKKEKEEEERKKREEDEKVKRE